ncbi:type I-C CRISPR-associated protein Cas8c/Csd1 [Saccharibacillus sp. JS10]|uniref:type I-C CRISPR-associated protein Cas8c/Csd1 n=1 Tax=Saccharibacillus sp. JS10 TaxID=2950552 RepID=UPI00210EE3D9|nr:type I-C CRISPR-associated protein Cas8c/Csd1 [Saccharibacillus sp. JS10]MCQ4085962.1 type I-C CRISPR-associated protein Cas8c/Csd1 [Saccharibacillus sp. JS10]
MIVQSLYERYEQLLQDPDSGMSKPGYSSDKVSFVLEIDRNGELLSIMDIRVASGKKQVPVRKMVPEHPVRTSGIKPFFLSDKAEYILGIVTDKAGGIQTSLPKFTSSAELHKRLLQTSHSDEAKSVISFYEHWNPEQVIRSDFPLYHDLLKVVSTTDNNLIFQLSGKRLYIHDTSEVLKEWDRAVMEAQVDSDAKLGTCLVTGLENQPLAQVHKVNIKGVLNAQQAGASLVSFNFKASESYGKEKSYNAPFSEAASIGYAKALNHLILSEHNRLRRMGDMTVVFWAERLPNEPQEDWTTQEGLFSGFFDGIFGATDSDEAKAESSEKESVKASKTAPRQEDTQLTRHVEDLLERVKNAETVEANMLPSKDASFYVLGMSGNNARLAVRFFWQSSFEELFRKLSQYASDMEMQPPGNRKSDLPTLFQIMLQTVRQTGEISKMRKNISGSMESEWFRAMLSGGTLPYSVFSAIVSRARVDGQMSPYGEHARNAWIRASVIKAYLTRYARIHHQQEMKEALTPMLNEEAQSVAYRLGRLFSVLERAQTDAAGGPGRLNTTIKDRYFGSASATPAAVFPILLRLAQHHMAKAEYGRFRDSEITSILKGVEAFPNHLDLKQQGLFMLGYYHQTAYRAPAKEQTATENLSEVTTETEVPQ